MKRPPSYSKIGPRCQLCQAAGGSGCVSLPRPSTCMTRCSEKWSQRYSMNPSSGDQPMLRVRPSFIIHGQFTRS